MPGDKEEKHLSLGLPKVLATFGKEEEANDKAKLFEQSEKMSKSAASDEIGVSSNRIKLKNKHKLKKEGGEMKKDDFGTIYEELRWYNFKQSGDINSARCFIEAREEAKYLQGLIENKDREM